MPFKDPAPSILTTLADTIISASGAYVDIAGDADQMELLVSNLDTALSCVIRDQLSTTQVGTLVGPGATACLTTSAAVRVINTGASNIHININRIKRA